VFSTSGLCNSPESVASEASSRNSALSRSLDEFFPLQASLRRYSRGSGVNAQLRAKSQSPFRNRSDMSDRETTLLSRYSNWVETGGSTVNSDDLHSFRIIAEKANDEGYCKSRSKSTNAVKDSKSVDDSFSSYISLKARKRFAAAVAPTLQQPWLPVKSIKQFTSLPRTEVKPLMRNLRVLGPTAATLKSRARHRVSSVGSRSLQAIDTEVQDDAHSFEKSSIASSSRQRTGSASSTSSGTDPDKKEAFSSLRSARANSSLMGSYVLGCKNHLEGAAAVVKEDASTWTSTSTTEVRSQL